MVLPGGTQVRVLKCMLMFHNNDQVLSVVVSPSSLFNDVLNRMYAMWPELRVLTVNLQYDIGKYKNICLIVDDDFQSLMFHIEEVGASSVDIYIKISQPTVASKSLLFTNGMSDVEEVGIEIPITMPPTDSASNSSPSMRSVNENAPDPEIPAYDCSPVEATKSLLSDSWANAITGVGQRFPGGVLQFRKELIKFATKKGFSFCYNKNNKTAVSVYCKQKLEGRCGWKVCGTMRRGVFQINSGCFSHGCQDLLGQQDQKRLGPGLMADIVLEQIKRAPTTTGIGLKDHLESVLGMEVDYNKAWRTLQTAKDKLFGIYQESFNDLKWYGAAAEATNPGTVYKLSHDEETNQFSRFFIAFKACLDGFKSCRPMLFIDATSLKGKFKGQLLTAIGKDGNNSLFPVAFAIVDSETVEHWTFFIRMLKDHVHHQERIFYLSDRHAGILAAFPAVYEEPVHFYCLYHLYTNLKGRYNNGWSNQFRKMMVGLLRQCAYAPTISLYEEHLSKFKDVGGPQACAFLENLPPAKWAVAHAPNVVRYGEMTSNAAESFNKVILKIRSLPVVIMMDTIRKLLVEWFAERRLESSSWTGALCPRKELYWNAASDKGRNWMISAALQKGVHEVGSLVSQSVDLVNKTCTCFHWQVQGFPCEHAIKAISKHCPTISSIVEPYFFTNTYRAAYSGNIMPIPSAIRGETERQLPLTPNILAPVAKATVGRPKRKRIPSFGEIPYKKVKPFKCPYCKEQGRHDVLTCGKNLEEQLENENELSSCHNDGVLD